MDGSQPTHPPPAPSSGIKLKFKLGGLNVSSASTSAAPPPPAAASSSKSAASISSAASVHPPTPAPPAPAPTTTAAAAAAPVTGKRVSVPSSKRQAAQQYDDYEEPAPAPRSSKSSNKHHRGGGGGESTHVKTESSAGAAKSSRARASSAAANAQAQAQAASAAAEAEEQELLAAQQHSYAQPSSASAAAAVPQQTTAAAFGPTGGSSGTSLNVRLAPPRQPLGINGVDALLAQHGEQALLGAPDMQKYNGLKRKYLEMTESHEVTTAALRRAQRQILRLREEKDALLDRVLMLENAAGMTDHGADLASDDRFAPMRAHEHPLLDPPAMPSLADREPARVALTANELSAEGYRNAMPPALPPPSFPPRQRSKHFSTIVAAEQLRYDQEARRAAYGLPRPNYPAAAILGQAGTQVGNEIERLLVENAGSSMPPPSTSGYKRKRESVAQSTTRGRPRLSAQPTDNNGSSFMGDGGASSLLQQQPSAIDSEDYGSPGGDGSDDYYASGGGGAPAQAPRGRGRPRTSGLDDQSGMSKAKRAKNQALASGKVPIPVVTRNPDGSPQMPLAVGIFTIFKLGYIVPSQNFHSERYIYPVGFQSTRRYFSMISKDDMADYACRIEDSGEGMPRFIITPSDQPANSIVAASPTGAWAQIVKTANSLRERVHSNSVSGPEYFGLAQNVVKALIQELPRANECQDYSWQHFVEDPDMGGVKQGPKKVLPHKRSFKRGPRGESVAADEDTDMYGTPEYGVATPSSAAPHALPSAGSPGAFGAGAVDAGHSLSSLIEAASGVSANPYSLPGAASIDPALGAGGDFGAGWGGDPYAIPAAAPSGDANGQQWHDSSIDPAFGGTSSYGHYDLPPP